EIHRPVFGGGHRRRRGQLRGFVRRRDGARHHRYDRQVLCSRGGALSALRGRFRAAPVAAERPSAATIGDMKRTRHRVAAIGHALPWAIAIVYFFAAASYLSFGTQIMIWILFAMSLDLALGYAGILTLGHAGFFGLGAYAAGLFAIHLSPDPI